MVAIIGTRSSTRRANAYTEELAEEFARAGTWVISGGALGIDTAAHRGALRAGGRTIVVQASGLGYPYPKQNRQLFEDIIQAGGAIVSESEHQTAPHQGLFLKRNRLVAAWASRVIVVQAPLRSGALHTARIALGLGRDVLVGQGAPWEPRHAGCNALLSRGAKPLSARPALPTNTSQLSEDARQLLLFVEEDDGQSADQLAARSNLDGPSASQALFELEMEQLVENRSGLFFSKES